MAQEQVNAAKYEEYTKRDGSIERQLKVRMNNQLEVSISHFDKNDVTYFHINRTSNGKKYYAYFTWEEYEEFINLKQSVEEKLYLIQAIPGQQSTPPPQQGYPLPAQQNQQLLPPQQNQQQQRF